MGLVFGGESGAETERGDGEDGECYVATMGTGA